MVESVELVMLKVVIFNSILSSLWITNLLVANKQLKFILTDPRKYSGFVSFLKNG
jgi:hypothetical protein